MNKRIARKIEKAINAGAPCPRNARGRGYTEEQRRTAAKKLGYRVGPFVLEGLDVKPMSGPVGHIEWFIGSQRRFREVREAVNRP